MYCALAHTTYTNQKQMTETQRNYNFLSHKLAWVENKPNKKKSINLHPERREWIYQQWSRGMKCKQNDPKK